MRIKEALSSWVRIHLTMGGDLRFLSLHSEAESQVVFRCVTLNNEMAASLPLAGVPG